MTVMEKIVILAALVALVKAELIENNIHDSESADTINFNNYHVYRVLPRNADQVAQLMLLKDTNTQFDFWTDVSKPNAPVDIMVPPNMQSDFEESVKEMKLDSKLLIDDVQALVERDSLTEGRSGNFDWTSYHRLNVIYNWMEDLTRRYPDRVTVFAGGSTYEGRQIKGVKVTFKEGNPGIFLESGIHAREWISPATSTYILNEVLTSQVPEHRAIFEQFNWWFIPIFNPDGYEYTHTTNRLWRKTRKPYGFCRGADLNRNWGFHWMDGGSSSNPCTDTYAGPCAFSEIESRSISQYITSIAHNIDVYLAFHSYSQLLLLPYGFQGPNNHVPDHNILMDIGTKAKDSLYQLYKTKYTVGNIADTIYVASGGSMDWVRGTHNTTVTFTYELRDDGRYGFLLPGDQIIPTGQETLLSVVTILEESKKYIGKVAQ